MSRGALLVAALGIAAAACAGGEDLPGLAVTSLAFGDGETIPERHTCAGADLSPPLRFEGAPADTAGYAVLMRQADEGAAAEARWIVWGITAVASGVGEGVPAGAVPGIGLAQGTNDLGGARYAGPCPEADDPEEHRFVFTAYALSAPPAVDPGATAAQLLAAIEGTVLAEGELEGVYAAE